LEYSQITSRLMKQHMPQGHVPIIAVVR